MCRGVSTDLTDVDEAGEGEEGLDEVLSLPPPAFVVGDGEDGVAEEYRLVGHLLHVQPRDACAVLRVGEHD